jgi:hypothetical protein
VNPARRLLAQSLDPTVAGELALPHDVWMRMLSRIFSWALTSKLKQNNCYLYLMWLDNDEMIAECKKLILAEQYLIFRSA